MFTTGQGFCFRPSNATELEDVSFAEAEFGDIPEGSIDEDEDDEPEPETVGPGLQRILSPDDHHILTDDQAYLVYLRPLITLSQVQIPGQCSMEGCRQSVEIKQDTVGSALYLKWVSSGCKSRL